MLYELYQVIKKYKYYYAIDSHKIIFVKNGILQKNKLIKFEYCIFKKFSIPFTPFIFFDLFRSFSN